MALNLFEKFMREFPSQALGKIGEKQMKVSVAMTTFNHERYISQAIDSVLIQDTNFDYELVIAEDCSTDKTREIVLDYQSRYPEKIKLILQENNVGPNRNGLDALRTCKGQYISILDGDDFWTSPKKLKILADFLDNNKEFVICFHNLQVVYENCNKAQHLSNYNQKEITTIKDLAQKNYIYTASCMFRNGLVDYPEWFCKSPIGDWIIHLLHARHGKIKFIDEVMGVYRVNGSGLWESKQSRYKREKLAEFGEVLFDKFDDEINRTFRKNHAIGCFDLGFDHFVDSNYQKAEYYLNKCIQANSLQIYDQYNEVCSSRERLLDSFDYRIGSAILKPIRFLKNLIK